MHKKIIFLFLTIHKYRRHVHKYGTINIWKGGKQVEIEIKLLEQMAKNNIRQVRALSKASGVSELAISNLLNEKTKGMRLDSLAKLCMALDCQIHELLVLKRRD